MVATPPTVLHLITGIETGGAEGTLERLAAGIDRTGLASIVEPDALKTDAAVAVAARRKRRS